MDINEILASVIAESEKMAQSYRDAMLRAEGGAYAVSQVVQLLEESEEAGAEEQEVV